MKKVIRVPVRKHPGVFLLVDEDIWFEYLRLGFSPNISLDRNGGGHRYARAMVWLPSPDARRSVAMSLPRIFVAIYAHLALEPLSNKGWTVGYRNGDHLDLRIENLVLASSTGQRNSFNVGWTVDARWKIAQEGGDAKVVLAARRQSFRATHKAAIRDDPKPPTPPSPRPRKKRLRGKP